jgi:hypothetical protein
MAEKNTLPAELKIFASTFNNAMPPAARPRWTPRRSPSRSGERGGRLTDPARLRCAIGRTSAAGADGKRIPTSFEIDLNYGAKASEGKKVFDTDAACASCQRRQRPGKDRPRPVASGRVYGKQALLDNIINPSEGTAGVARRPSR